MFAHTQTHKEKNMSTPTNGYVIRLELLKMAKEMLEQDWHAQRDAVMSDYNNRVGFAHAKAESLGFQNTDLPAIPTFKAFPTEAEIIAKAKTLNDFISSK
jgi:hypothetical protein